jgi:hypothetical protein
MQALLSAMQRQQGGRDAAVAEELARRQAAAEGPSLGEVLKPDVLAPLLADEEVRSHSQVMCHPVRLCAQPCKQSTAMTPKSLSSWVQHSSIADS